MTHNSHPHELFIIEPGLWKAASMAAILCKYRSRFSTGTKRAASMTILSWVSVRAIMCDAIGLPAATSERNWHGGQGGVVGTGHGRLVPARNG